MTFGVGFNIDYCTPKNKLLILTNNKIIGIFGIKPSFEVKWDHISLETIANPKIQGLKQTK